MRAASLTRALPKRGPKAGPKRLVRSKVQLQGTSDPAYMLSAGRFLLLLDANTWTSRSCLHLAEDVERALRAGQEILLVHENNDGPTSIAFSTLLEPQQTPAYLVHAGLYGGSLAVPLYSGEHRLQSMASAFAWCLNRLSSDTCRPPPPRRLLAAVGPRLPTVT